MTPSERKAAKLAQLFQEVSPPEIAARELAGKSPQEVLLLLPVYGGRNPVFAILVDVHTTRAYGLRSGWTLEDTEFQGIIYRKGNLSWSVAVRAGGLWRQLGCHVEAQAAAFMRKAGMVEAILYINATTPCQGPEGWLENLPALLPVGARLTVINKRGELFPFVGLTDGGLES